MDSIKRKQKWITWEEYDPKINHPASICNNLQKGGYDIYRKKYLKYKKKYLELKHNNEH